MAHISSEVAERGVFTVGRLSIGRASALLERADKDFSIIR